MAAQVRAQDYGKPFLSNYLLDVHKNHLYHCSCQFFKTYLNIYDLFYSRIESYN